MTIHAVAGYCHETVLWKMILDVCSELLDGKSKEWRVLMPDTVVVDGEKFRLEHNTQQTTAPEFYPPEGIGKLGEAATVWSLGALICYASSGHYIFGGRGGTYQHDNPQVELPMLRKDHACLNALVQRCLCYSPDQRISLKELQEAAQKGMETARKKARKKMDKVTTDAGKTIVFTDDGWPEKMG